MRRSAWTLVLLLAATPALAGCTLPGKSSGAAVPNDNDIGTSGWIIEKTDFYYKESRLDGESWREAKKWANPKGAATVEVDVNITGGSLRVKIVDGAGNIAWDQPFEHRDETFMVPMGDKWAKGNWQIIIEAREATGSFRIHLFMRPYV